MKRDDHTPIWVPLAKVVAGLRLPFIWLKGTPESRPLRLDPTLLAEAANDPPDEPARA